MENSRAPGPHWKHILIPLITLAVLIIGYGVLAKNNNWWPASPDASQGGPHETVYQNKEYGFALELPASWNGYEASVNTYRSDDIYNGIAAVHFSVPNSYAGPNCENICTQDVLSILVYSPKLWQDWLAEQKTPNAPERIFLAENESYVFSYEPSLVTQNRYGEDLKVQHVLSTFHLIPQEAVEKKKTRVPSVTPPVNPN